MKRILALLGVIVIVVMYMLTMVFAIIDNPATMGMFKASVAMTIIVPTMIYGYQVVFRVLKNMGNNKPKEINDTNDK